MLKKFLQEHPHLSVKFSYFGRLGGYWEVQVFNHTFDFCTPIFEYKMTSEELDALNVDFETALMTSVTNWWNIRHKKEGL